MTVIDWVCVAAIVIVMDLVKLFAGKIVDVLWPEKGETP